MVVRFLLEKKWDNKKEKKFNQPLRYDCQRVAVDDSRGKKTKGFATYQTCEMENLTNKQANNELCFIRQRNYQ